MATCHWLHNHSDWDAPHSTEKSRNMVFNRFNFKISIYLIIIWLLGVTGLYLIISTPIWLTGVVLIFINIIALFNLILHVNRHRSDLAIFLNSIRFKDFSNQFQSQKNNPNTDEVKRALQEINHIFRELQQEKAAKEKFLETIIAQVPVAVLVLSEENEIKLHNAYFLQLIGKKQAFKLSAQGAEKSPLIELLLKIQPGEQRMFSISNNPKPQNLAVRCAGLRMHESDFRIITLQDIRIALEQKETESWQKLIKVLTHEIMNSVIPISTLSEVALETTQKLAQETDANDLHDLSKSLQTITNRSKGLASFVHSYKQISDVKIGQIQEVNIVSLLAESIELFASKIEKQNIQVELNFDEEVAPYQGDPHLLSQVCINIVKNAIEALEKTDKPQIKISVKNRDENTSIIVEDNGIGIAQELAEQIFVPFFTTKNTGSGVGLSFCRQVIHMHGGNIQVKSQKDQGTQVEIVL
jgi:two-component system, NtrC family, nitrogen regulation sensor histidine kinase NtrY